MLALFTCLLLLVLPAFPAKPTTRQCGDVFLNFSSNSTLRGTRWNISGTLVDAYLGIPFAKPPTGKLRFAPPVEADPWPGELNATRMPRSCWQFVVSGFDVNNPAARIWANNTEMSEDCLYLNVWKPANLSQSAASLPVMVWIFGGGFFSGSSTLDVYDGKYLAAIESVVVVSMQYRLGPFGFLYVRSQVGGNMGLLDQQLALKWVQKHIATFNGDPKMVTLFGESAGAVSVGLQYLSPSSRPLFKRIILQSSGPLNRWALSKRSDAHETGISFIKASGCSDKHHNLANEVDCLRQLPADNFFNLLSELTVASTRRRANRLAVMSLTPQWPVAFLPDASQYFDVHMRPVLDGDFLPDCPGALLASITSQEAPEALLGNVANEGMYWLFYGLGIKGINFLHENGTVTLPSLEELRNPKIDYLQLIQTRFMSIGYLVDPFPAIVTIQYGLNSPGIPNVASYNTGIEYNALTSNVEFLNRLDTLSGDLDFVCSTRLFARLLSNIGGSKVQFYQFSHKTNNSQFPPWVGTMHGYEIEYVFGMPFSETFTSQYYNFTDEEAALSRRIMRYWANFARTGNAANDMKDINGPDRWPYFNTRNQHYLEISLNTTKVKEALCDKGCTFWNDVFPSLVRTHLRRSGYQSYYAHEHIETCSYMEVNLHSVRRLRDFVDGVYPDGSTRLMLPYFTVLSLLWTLFH